MEIRFDRLEEKVDVIDAKLDNIDKIMAVNTEQLAVHIKRTNLLEDYMRQSDKKIDHIEKHVVRVNTVVKVLMVIGSIAAFLVGAIISIGQLFPR